VGAAIAKVVANTTTTMEEVTIITKDNCFHYTAIIEAILSFE
jgi:hypothetical protein